MTDWWQERLSYLRRRDERREERMLGPRETRQEAARASDASEFSRSPRASVRAAPDDWSPEENMGAIRRARGATSQPLDSATGESQAPFGDDFAAWYRAVTAPRPSSRGAAIMAPPDEEQVRFDWGENSADPANSRLSPARPIVDQPPGFEPASAESNPAPPEDLNETWRAAVLRSAGNRPHRSLVTSAFQLMFGRNEAGEARELRERVENRDY